MLIVNTTYQVEDAFREEWIQWVKTEYIPLVVQTGLMTNPRFSHLLIENETGTQSYALQFEVEDLGTLEHWFEQHGKPMQNTMSNRFQEHALGFTTLMETL